MNNKDFYSLCGRGYTHSLQKRDSWGTREKKKSILKFSFQCIGIWSSLPLLCENTLINRIWWREKTTLTQFHFYNIITHWYRKKRQRSSFKLGYRRVRLIFLFQYILYVATTLRSKTFSCSIGQNGTSR